MDIPMDTSMDILMDTSMDISMDVSMGISMGSWFAFSQCQDSINPDCHLSQDVGK